MMQNQSPSQALWRNAESHGAAAPGSAGGADYSPGALLSSFWRGRWVLLGCVLLTMLAAWIYLINAPERYRSSARIHLERNGPDLPKALLDFAGEGGGDLHAQAELIRSTRLLSRARDLLREQDPPAGETLSQTAALQQSLRVSPDPQSGTLTISVEAAHPELAAAAASVVVEAYRKDRAERRRSSNAQMLELIRKEKSRQQQRLEPLRQKMLELRRSGGAVASDPAGREVSEDRFRGLADRLSKVHERITALELALRAAEQAKDNPRRLRRIVARQPDVDLPPATQPGSDKSDRASLQRLAEKLRVQLGEMRASLGPDHPSLRSTRTRLRNVQRRLSREKATSSPEARGERSQAYLDALNEELVLAKQKRQHLKEQIANLQEESPDREAEAIRKRRLQARIRRHEQTLEKLHERAQALSLQANSAPQQITVLDPARPAARPAEPRWGRILALAVALGLILGCGGAYAFDQCDPRFRSAAEIASLFQRPVLGAIPRIPGRRQTSVAERIRRAHADPHSDAAEGARSLATTLRHGSEGTSANTVLISSPLPDEGKTAASAMLATSLAQMGERVLVVDANCRRPMMHEAFAIPGTPGLVDSVNGRARLEDGIVRTGSAGAFVLPLGTAPGDPMELLNSEAFERGLGELSAQFDRVLLDAPATVPVSDARVLAAHCDATMMVLRPDRSDRRSALHARDLLEGVGARIIGSVANAAPRRSSFGWHGRIGYASGGTPADPHAADSAHAASPSQTADASDSDNGTHPADQRHGRGTTGSEQKPEGLRRPPSAGVSRP